jgi:hypothetical protein
MRALHAAVAAAGAVAPDSLSAPARWAPHVTLARRVAAPDVDRAVELVTRQLERDAPVGMPVVASAVRRWDGSRQREWLVASAAQT